MGPSGSGKSDLALRLIDRGAVLVADDQVILTKCGNGIAASVPDVTAGKLEVRSIGIVEFNHVENVTLQLKVNLSSQPERFPMDSGNETLLDRKIPTIYINPFEPSAPAKIELALKRLKKVIDPEMTKHS
ncbi:HPr kinase/phosphorylase [hydrothermal vent metagenome]|uniref:HPr kinase/phosphorylase n=1 Tax=hydrothermal vent metagenome TaxID=652676 RepID=A0A3B0RFR1_9ZZZZ